MSFSQLRSSSERFNEQMNKSDYEIRRMFVECEILKEESPLEAESYNTK